MSGFLSQPGNDAQFSAFIALWGSDSSLGVKDSRAGLSCARNVKLTHEFRIFSDPRTGAVGGKAAHSYLSKVVHGTFSWWL